PHLPAELLREALAAARAIGDEWTRAEALQWLAPHLPAELLREALAAARAIGNEQHRAEALAALAPRLAECPALDKHFAPTLRDVARRGRPALLGAVNALLPWLAALAERHQQPDLLGRLATAVIETARCWQ
ncbi:MAG: hypothetical protein ACUVSW_08490, partial [Roseiflexus sp.]